MARDEEEPPAGWRGPLDDEPPDWESTPSEPSAADMAAIRALVDEILRRAGGE